MRNIKLTIEYDGTNFNGWQIQGHDQRTVQGEIEKVLHRIFKTQTRLIGSGRTDSGVHAKGQVAHFKADSSLQPIRILKAINTYLPEDVSVVKVEDVTEDFHAQYSVKSKIYRYTVLNSDHRLPLSRFVSFVYPYRLNLAVIRQEAKSLIGKKDFRSFQSFDPALKPKKKNSVRTIKKLTIKKRGDFVYIDIEADGFLYKMVRNIVGTLLEIGSGLKPKGSIKKILRQKDRTQAGQTAAAHGLCLLEVKY